MWPLPSRGCGGTRTTAGVIEAEWGKMSDNRDDRRPGRSGRSGAEAPKTQPGSGVPSDGIDQAIADTQPSPAVEMVDTGVVMINRTGRPFKMIVPKDLTGDEARAIVSYVIGLPEQLAARKGPQILVPTGPVIRPQ